MQPDGASPAMRVAHRLVQSLGVDGAHRAIDLVLDGMPVVDVAALAYDWKGTWARPKQIPPAGSWRSWGFLTGRGFGKSRSIGEHVHEEVEAGRLMSLGLCAQNEGKSAELAKVLIDTAPPWFLPEHLVTDGLVVWPNGAKAFIRTPEAPEAIRSENHEACWLSEIQSWPVATREEAYSNFLFATRLGYARTFWDATPKKRHPILTRFLKRAEKDPTKHIVVRGTMYENAANLGAGVLADLETEFGGTTKGREELLGEMLDASENALVDEDWIEHSRRRMPERIVRRALAIDPAVTARRGSDRTGIVEGGTGVDGQGYVLGDYSGKHEPHEWAEILLDRYVKGHCDVVIVETNKGGALVTQTLRAAAKERGLSVVVVGEKERPQHTPGTVFVVEVFARGPKEDRAQPLATAYERGRVSHVIGVELGELETLLTTWEPTPGARSPDALDALTHLMVHLLELAPGSVDHAAGFKGIKEIAEKLVARGRSAERPSNLASMLRSYQGAPKI